MNKETLNEQLINLEARNPGLKIFGPKDLQPQETANNLIGLLQAMYVEHGITKNKEKLVSDITNGKVLTWFAKKDGKFIATASLVKQSDGAWELGRAVSLDRGNGVGKKVILEALRFHIENHPGIALTAEVRAAAEFEGIPSGEATQKIFFGLIDQILPITPFAAAPLFAHGDPLRNEQFILSASDVKPGKTISQRIAEVTNNRSTKGVISRVKVVQTSPFQCIVPDEEGVRAVDILQTVDNFNGCTLFPIETTDRNMPLIGMLSANKNMVVCGVDRVVGKEGKPILFIAELGLGQGSDEHSVLHTNHGDFVDFAKTILAPSKISESLPTVIAKDLEHITNLFTHNNHTLRNNREKEEILFWKQEAKDFRRWKLKESARKRREQKAELALKHEEVRRRKEEIWEG